MEIDHKKYMFKRNQKCKVNSMAMKDKNEIKSFYNLSKRIIKSRILKNSREESDLAVMFYLSGMYILNEGKSKTQLVDLYYVKILDEIRKK